MERVSSFEAAWFRIILGAAVLLVSDRSVALQAAEDGHISDTIVPAQTAPLPPCDLVVYVNGMSTSYEEALDQAGSLAESLRMPVRLVYNDLTLPVVDHIAIFWDKLWSADVSLNAATDSLQTLLKAELLAGKRVGVVAYSAGSIVTLNALRSLAEPGTGLQDDALELVHVLTVGSAVFEDEHALADGWPRGLGGCFHLYSNADFVAQYVGPGEWGSSDGRAHSFQGVYLPAIERSMLSHTGTRVLEFVDHAPTPGPAAANASDDDRPPLFVMRNWTSAERRMELFEWFAPIVHVYHVGPNEDVPDTPLSVEEFLKLCEEGLSTTRFLAPPRSARQWADTVLGDEAEDKHLPLKWDTEHPMTWPNDGTGVMRRWGQMLLKSNRTPTLYCRATVDKPKTTMEDLDWDGASDLLRIQFFMLYPYNETDPQHWMQFLIVPDIKKWDHIGDWVGLELTVRSKPIRGWLQGEGDEQQITEDELKDWLDEAEVVEAWFHVHGFVFIVRPNDDKPDRSKLNLVDGRRPKVWLEKGSHEAWFFEGGPGPYDIGDVWWVNKKIGEGESQAQEIIGTGDFEDVIREHKGTHAIRDWHFVDIGDPALGATESIPPGLPLEAAFARTFRGHWGSHENSPDGPTTDHQKFWHRCFGKGYSPQPWSHESEAWRDFRVALPTAAAILTVAGVAAFLIVLGPGGWVVLAWLASIGLALYIDLSLSFGTPGGGDRDGDDSALEGLPPLDEKPGPGEWAVDLDQRDDGWWFIVDHGEGFEDFVRVPAQTCPDGQPITVDRSQMRAGVVTDDAQSVKAVVFERRGLVFNLNGEEETRWVVRPDSVFAEPESGPPCGSPPPCPPEILADLDDDNAIGEIGWCGGSIYWRLNEQSHWQHLLRTDFKVLQDFSIRGAPSGALLDRSPDHGAHCRLAITWGTTLFIAEFRAGQPRPEAIEHGGWRTDGRWLQVDWDNNRWVEFGAPFAEQHQRAELVAPREDAQHEIARPITSAQIINRAGDAIILFTDKDGRQWMATEQGARRWR